MSELPDREYDRDELLYDPVVIQGLGDEFDNPASIKEHVDTNAFIYEIRTALRYWNDGRNTYRCSDRIWSNCEAYDEGEWAQHD